jgi:hypothetical protein
MRYYCISDIASCPPPPAAQQEVTYLGLFNWTKYKIDFNLLPGIMAHPSEDLTALPPLPDSEAESTAGSEVGGARTHDGAVELGSADLFVIEGLQQARHEFRWLAEEDGVWNDQDPLQAAQMHSPELDPVG